MIYYDVTSFWLIILRLRGGFINRHVFFRSLFALISGTTAAICVSFDLANVSVFNVCVTRLRCLQCIYTCHMSDHFLLYTHAGLHRASLFSCHVADFIPHHQCISTIRARPSCPQPAFSRGSTIVSTGINNSKLADRLSEHCVQSKSDTRWFTVAIVPHCVADVRRSHECERDRAPINTHQHSANHLVLPYYADQAHPVWVNRQVRPIV